MMKSLVLPLMASFAILVSGCAGTDRIVVQENGSIGASKTFRVFQVLDQTHALAMTCESRWADYCHGDIALIVVPDGTLLYDDKRVTIEKPVVRDTYTYETTQGRQKTVPVVEQAPDSTVNQ